ncbi:hypothetical protein Zmor_014088 [Zophobas morio]|uniref:Uncharacterized protein n=1 Tax=Zophobas morio TaxID=2755281 RepID=A0AA38MFS5_9CUCU|nr:hypothetical protein Zmor_014088 [Zophobas morio]
MCGEEEACKDFQNNTHTCICTHDSLPPTAEGTCPRRTVSMDDNAGRIPNVQPPLNKPTPSSLSSTTIPVTAANEHLPGPDYVIVSIVVSACVFLIMLSGILFRRKFRSRHLSNEGVSPINLKHSLLMAERYAPNPQYSACSGTGVPLLRKETLKFISEIGEGCFGKVYKELVCRISRSRPRDFRLYCLVQICRMSHLGEAKHSLDSVLICRMSKQKSIEYRYPFLRTSLLLCFSALGLGLGKKSYSTSRAEQ